MEDETADETIARLTEENAKLRQQVIKGRDIAKLLAEKYGEKLASVQTQHEEELRVLRDSTRLEPQDSEAPPAVAGETKGDDLAAKYAELEGSLEQFIQLTTQRENILLEHIAKLKRKVGRRNRYIEELEADAEELEERVNVVEGKVRGVVREAQTWHARERSLLEKAKEDALLAVHLAQREKLGEKSHKETAARLERSEKKIRELEEELKTLTRFVNAGRDEKERTSPPPTTEETKSLNNLTSISSNSTGSIQSLPSSSAGHRKSALNRRARGHHQRSESLGTALLQHLSSGGKDSQERPKERSEPLAGDIVQPTITHPPAQPTISHFVAPPMHEPPVPNRISPRGSAPAAVDQRLLRATSPNLAGSGSASASSSRRGSRRKVPAPPAGESATPSDEAATAAATDSRRSRRTRSMKVTSSSKNDNDVSAETLAQVEAEIQMLLAQSSK